jgi:Fe(3+) dicitrate transport protein
MRYTLRQPGGRTEAQFAADPWGSARPRDWFAAPWFVPQLTLSHAIGAHSTLTVNAFGLYGERNSLGVITAPTVADTGLNARRLDRDAYRNAGVEARLVHGTRVAARPLTLALGLRATTARTTRMSARGADGESFRLDETGGRTRDLAFDTRGAAAFAEAGLEVAPGVVVSPGVRVESIRMTGRGAWTPASGATFLPTGAATAVNDVRSQAVALGGLGLSVTRWEGIELYGNATQSFRPATFSELFPTSLVAVDAGLGPARGLSTDIGLRSTSAGLLTYDVSLFWLRYDDRIGTVRGAALGADSLRYPAGLVRNVGRSEHYGAEAFAELDVTRAVGAPTTGGAFAWWTSVGRTEARYVGSALDGNRVEYAPRWIARSGLTWRRGGASATLQGSYVDGTFSDASNTAFRADGLQGWIPAYRVLDATVRLPVWESLAFEASVNNLTGARYFTRRAGGYPGPGIIPADGRVLVAGVRWSGR